MADWTSLLQDLNTTVLSAFGREVTYLPQASSEFTLRAIFESAREVQENAPGVYAVLFVQLADCPQKPQRGDDVTVDDVTYKVFDIEADTSGAMLLRLRQV